MSETSFAEFYQLVHGRLPFPWQERLAARAVAGDWPKAIAVPTGCGKTSVIDVAVYALAVQAEANERTAAMRIFFIVDRRLVVDDVYRHACELAEAINDPAKGGWVREQLLKFRRGELEDTHALEVAILRGGMYRSNSWADAPNQPLVCVSTVDQVGSRLLFRGYGVSDSRRPVDAGLIGNDSLLIVDEAHLSQPFLQTLEAVERYQSQDWRKQCPARGLQFVQMSATIKGSFSLADEDFAGELLKARLEAKKPAELKEAANIPQAAAEEAAKAAQNGARVVGVVLNTVAGARAAFDLLQGEKVLLTGRVRPYERDQLLKEYRDKICAGRDRSVPAKLFAVATQTIEVGADLDFDALITEAAPLEALRQRFGRLDRLGQLQSTTAVILKPKRAKDRDWVYGEDTDRAWDWLVQRGSPVNFGILAMRDAPADLCQKRENAPLMFPAYVDAWAQTNPRPAAEADVAPFLHGPGALEPGDVQIVWRADLENIAVGDWSGILAAAPPLSTEALALPIGAARRWLAGKAAAVADVEGVAAAEEQGQELRRREYLIWRGPEKSVPGGTGRLRPGDTIVVRSSEGGCDRYGWNPGSKEPVEDIGDLCANQRAAAGGGKARLRIHPLVWKPANGETPEEIRSLLDGVEKDDEDAMARLREMVNAGQEWDWAWPPWNYGAGNALLVQSKTRKKRQTTDTDETDENDSSSFTAPVWLDEHMEGVAGKARIFLGRCGFNGAAAATVCKAAALHDLGKWDTRFQLKLGNTGERPWAKSEDRRRRDSEYPAGARHEYTSVALAEQGATWPEDCDCDLALYLIGTHHGFGRPFPPVWTDGDYEIQVELDGRIVKTSHPERAASIASGWAERFWQLNRKYGWWGLAYLEAVLRRADCVRSREEQEERQ